MKIKIISIIIAALTLGACNTTQKVKPEVFTVDLKSTQIKTGEIEAQIDNLFSAAGLKKVNAIVLYFPDEDAVCLQYRIDFTTYYQFWSRDGRDTFIEALASYNEDYDARNLNSRGGKKTRYQYGVVQGYLIWQTFSFSVQAKANMNVELGYVFKDRSPYFCVNQKQAEYEDKETRDNSKTTSVMPAYFTRTQAQEVAALFDQQFLDSLSLPADSRRNTSAAIEVDEY